MRAHNFFLPVIMVLTFAIRIPHAQGLMISNDTNASEPAALLHVNGQENDGGDNVLFRGGGGNSNILNCGITSLPNVNRSGLFSILHWANSGKAVNCKLKAQKAEIINARIVAGRLLLKIRFKAYCNFAKSS